MEACCISSNSFTKSMENLPVVKGKVHTFAKTSKFQTAKKHIPPLSISCCRSTSRSSSLGSNQDEMGSVLVNSDWRAFRARLVAKEQSGMMDLGKSFLDKQEPMSSTTTTTTEDKWAHRIHEPEKGCLLIATEKLDGVHVFERTVILVVSSGPVGPTGLILNRPSLMSIKEAQESPSSDMSSAFSDRPLFYGGPFEDGLFMMSPKGEKNDDTVATKTCGGFDELMDGVYYGTKESLSVASDMVKRNVVQVGDLKFFDGYCAWEKGQLRDEIRAGKWTVAACSPSVVGLNSVGKIGLWEEVNELLSPQKVW